MITVKVNFEKKHFQWASNLTIFCGPNHLPYKDIRSWNLYLHYLHQQRNSGDADEVTEHAEPLNNVVHKRQQNLIILCSARTHKCDNSTGNVVVCFDASGKSSYRIYIYIKTNLFLAAVLHHEDLMMSPTAKAIPPDLFTFEGNKRYYIQVQRTKIHYYKTHDLFCDSMGKSKQRTENDLSTCQLLQKKTTLSVIWWILTISQQIKSLHFI